MGTRRSFLLGTALLSGGAICAISASATGVRAAPAALVVTVPNNAVGALVNEIGGPEVQVRVDPKLDATRIQISGTRHDIAAKIRLKGTGIARGRYLDDGRNASRVGAHIRDILAQARPQRQELFASRHKSWSRPFARECLNWGRKLQASKVSKKKIRDDYARAYLLGWAGATVDSRGQKAPKSLKSLPQQPSAPTLSAYRTYLNKLVAALG